MPEPMPEIVLLLVFFKALCCKNKVNKKRLPCTAKAWNKAPMSFLTKILISNDCALANIPSNLDWDQMVHLNFVIRTFIIM